MRILKLILFSLLLFSINSHCQSYAFNANNNYVIFLWAQSNGAGFPTTDSCFNQYRENSNCKIYDGHVWNTLSVATNTNEFPSKANLFAFEMSLCYTLQNYTKGNIYVIKYAIGGTAMENFWKVGQLGYTNFLYYVNHGLYALDSLGIKYTVAGCYSYQGESDAAVPAYAATYGVSLTAMLNQIRIDLSMPNLPYYIVRIHKQCPYDAAGIESIRAADSTFVAGDGGLSQWVSVDDLARYTGSSHISALSQITLGIRLANLTTPNLTIKKYHP